MRDPVVAPHGSWRSPITADVIVAGILNLGQAALDGDDVYWTEGRPTEGGRCVIVRRGPDGSTSDVTPAPFNVRTRVHEYGGGAFAVATALSISRTTTTGASTGNLRAPRPSPSRRKALSATPTS